MIIKLLLFTVTASPDILPVIPIFPVPFIVLLFRSRLPPSCGVVSPTKSVFTVSNVGSAPLFARKNLPLLDDVPCTNLSNVTD